MTPSNLWEQWDGQGYPPSKLDPVIYYYPGTVDIEDPDELQNLIEVVFMDGVAPSRIIARVMADSAVVVHGQVVDIEGELNCYFGPEYGIGEDGYAVTHKATWVEFDEYDD